VERDGFMHIYHINEKAYPSVTTIVHSLGSEELMKWSNIMGFKHKKYEDLMEESSRFGTLMHSHLQFIVDPEHAPDPIKCKDAIEEFRVMSLRSKFIRYMSQFKYITYYTEKSLVSDKLGYGGTLDWYAQMNGYKILNDFKTSKAVQIGMLLQLGGYSNLLRECEGEIPDGCSIILVNDRQVKMNLFNQDDMIFFGEVFQSLADFYNKSIEIKVNPRVDFFEELKQKRDGE